MSPSPRGRRALLSASAAAILMGPIVASALGAVPPLTCQGSALCPNLTVDIVSAFPQLGNINYAPTDCAVVEGMAPPGPQRVVRFTTALPNLGPGHFVIGRPSEHPERFVYSDCHRHYHTKDYADYRVWTPQGYAAWAVLRTGALPVPASELLDQLPVELQPVAGGKQGFCVIDVRPYLPVFGQGGFGCGNMGISAGWGDVYGSGITGQWVVITGVPAGTYVLEIEVNADRFFPEVEFASNSVGVPFQIV